MRRYAVLAVAAGLLLGACANDPYDRGALVDGLEDTGLSAAESECVVAGMERRIGVLRLGTREEPTAREREVVAEVLAGCTAAPEGGSGDDGSG